MVLNDNDSSWALQHLREAISEVSSELQRPFWRARPQMTYSEHDGQGQFMIEYGDFGLVAMAPTPEEVSRKFDRFWMTGQIQV